MKTYLVEPESIPRWQAKPGCRILVMGGGAVRFDFPKDWLACADSKIVHIIDREPPADRCSLMASWRHLSMPMAGVRMEHLLQQVTVQSSDSRPIVQRGGVISFSRHPLDAAWRQMHFLDERRGGEACTRVCLARGGRTLATIVLDFWLEDELRVHSVWTTMMETLAVGDYIDDPITGRRREQRG
jgi:hypothetical protein